MTTRHHGTCRRSATRSLAVTLCTLSALGGGVAGGGAVAEPPTASATSTPGYQPPGAAQSPAAGVTSLVKLAFDGLRAGDDPATVRNRGRLAIHTTVASAASGRILVEPRADGGQALRFPSLSREARAPRAVLAVTPASADAGLSLDPRDHDFSFGADFALDALSEQPSLDNGNNLVQRGLSSDPAQYKAQVDHGRASCRVAGAGGAVVAESASRVEPGTWYTLKCSRHSTDLVLRLTRLRDGHVERVTAYGVSGDVVLPARTPLAVGGKVTSQGKAVERNSDQFNGAVDNVFVRVADGG